MMRREAGTYFLTMRLAAVLSASSTDCLSVVAVLSAVSKEDQNLLISGTDGIRSPSLAFSSVTETTGSLFSILWKLLSAAAPRGLSSLTVLSPSSVRR